MHISTSVATKLSHRALLVTLAISQWTARKLDKSETEALARKHGTAADVARVHKTLLPFAEPLEKLHKKSGEIRTFYYEQSLPWCVDGSRIMPATNYLDFQQTMRKLLNEWHALKDAFIVDYPRLKQEAKLLLNGMYREDDYPDVAEIDRKFRADVSFFPMPDASDFRVALAQDEMERIAEDIEARVKDATAEAMQDCWRRVRDVVSKAAERLAQPDAIFRDSLVENAVELCKLLPRLNLTDDPNLEAARRELEGSLCKYNPETLRKAPEVRQEVAAKMDDLMSKMGAWMGGV
jgi:hypothetical protein